MRTCLALGLFSLVAAAGMAACGDDDTPDRSGIGGSSGAAGAAGAAAGSGGTAGASGSSGSGGSAGRGGSGTGGSGGTPPDIAPRATCTGCVELITPVVGPRSQANVADEASFIFQLGAPVDFSDGVITWRIAAVQPNAGYSVELFAQNGQALGYAGVYADTTLQPAAFPANEFREITLDLAAIAAAPGDAGAPDASVTPDEPAVVADAGAADAGDAGGPVSTPPNVSAGFDKSQIIQIGVFVGVNESFTGNATVRVAVDEVRIAGVPGQADRTFTAGAEGLSINPYNIPPSTPAPVHHP